MDRLRQLMLTMKQTFLRLGTTVDQEVEEISEREAYDGLDRTLTRNDHVKER